MRERIIAVILVILIFSCKTVDNKKDISDEIAARSERENRIYEIDIDVVDGESYVLVDSELIGETPVKRNLYEGVYDVVLERENYPDQICRLEVNSSRKYLFRHNKYPTPVKEIGVFGCGSQPKQVIFSPDDKFIYIPLLDDTGFQVFSMEDMKIVDFVNPPDPKHRKGYPEGLFVKNTGSFYISQMSGNVYEYGYPELVYRRTVPTGGLWSKFITYSSAMNCLAVSNWSSNNVSIIDSVTGKLLRLIKTPASPRGLAFSSDDRYFYITSFDGGKIMKVDTGKWAVSGTIYVANAAMRHIVIAGGDREAFVSDMYHAKIYDVNLEKFNIVKSYSVDYNPNTIDLTPDGKYLFVSSRGPNNAESYLKRSPRNGMISVIDVVNSKKLSAFEGGRQPTGLDVSNNGKYLCFSNFQDNNIEIYWIGDLR